MLDILEKAADAPPPEYVRQQGWVLTALHNALWQLLHAPDLEEGVIDTIMRGGDTDTNAAIAGALLGAVYGIKAVPERWTRTILDCRPAKDRPEVAHPRPKDLWPVDALWLAKSLVKRVFLISIVDIRRSITRGIIKDLERNIRNNHEVLEFMDGEPVVISVEEMREILEEKRKQLKKLER